MTRTQVLKKLNDMRGHKSVLAFSKEIQVTQQILDRVLKAKQPPTPAILKLLGLKRIVTTKETFVPVEGDHPISSEGRSTHGNV